MSSIETLKVTARSLVSQQSTAENRRACREMLFTAPGVSTYISGAILYDETIRQSAAEAPLPPAMPTLWPDMWPSIRSPDSCRSSSLRCCRKVPIRADLPRDVACA